MRFGAPRSPSDTPARTRTDRHAFPMRPIFPDQCAMPGASGPNRPLSSRCPARASSTPALRRDARRSALGVELWPLGPGRSSRQQWARRSPTIMPTLIITRGLPASGKTTWARERLRTTALRAARVNRDDLRRVLHGGLSGASWAERQVTLAQHASVAALLPARVH